MLAAQLAAEKEFLEKRDAIRKKFDNSVKRANASKDEDGAVGGRSKSDPDQAVEEWLQQSRKTNTQQSVSDVRGAFPKGGVPLGAGVVIKANKTKSMKPVKEVPEIVENEPEPSEDESSESLDYPAKSRHNQSRYGSMQSSHDSDGPGRDIGHISKQQLAARKALSQYLWKLRGEPEAWPLFISCFEHTTCGFTDLENLKRLQDCLQGDALEAVRSRLVLPDLVPDVICDLRNLFGRPEKLLKKLLPKVRNFPAPRGDQLETFINFWITVKQLCDHHEAAQLRDHLNNPMLIQELVDKLPPIYKLDWVRFKRGKIDSPLRMFSNFTTEIVSDVSEVTEFTMLSVYERARPGRDNPRKKEFVYMHELAQKRSEGSRIEAVSQPCWICERTDHLIRNCDEFRRMNIAERLREVERQKLCGICLNKHSSSRCSSKIRCVVRDCQGNHHPLLHRVERSVQLQKAISDCTFLDEGLSATLVDDVVAERLKAEGSLKPLIVTWTGNINRFENESRCVEMMVAAKGSKEKFPLFNTRTVSELQLPKQNVRYAEVVKRYTHLVGVPVKDFPSGVPTILIGLDNLHLFAPLESRVGRPNEPIAVRSKMGWTIYGSEKRRASVHSIATVSNQELHDLMREQYVLEETAGASFAVPEPLEEKRAREILEATTQRVGHRFETGLLWRSDVRKFPDSYSMAMRRMHALDRILERNPALKENVCRQIEEYQQKGYAHKVTDAELMETAQSAVWYLPLNVVVSPRRPGKVRLVWDAAASVNGISLNSELLKGPDMLVPLPRVICHFRELPVAFGGDIQEMYHQICITSEDKQAQRFPI
ncbi:uncharacterized protein LOC134205990 [Armigeres subalbatus]|uniref:uncharacterized protein LOC134205990 n=1 Tax=Armigeres subalbatus TaxID=124917 RepID=UPI002ED4D238